MRPPPPCSRTARFGMLLATLLSALACMAPAASSGAEPVRLGMSAAFSGPSKVLGVELHHGSSAYFDSVNERGGLFGRPIEITARDDRCEFDPAIRNTLRFLQDRSILLLFNYAGAPALRVLPLLRKYSGRNIFMLFPFTGAQALRAPPYDAYVFNLRPSRLQETEELIDRLASSGHSRISVFYQADACGRSGWVGVRTALARRSLSIASEASYRRGATFLNSMARQVNIIQAANPDAVVAVGTCEACAAFIRDARNANLDVPIANLGLAGSEHLLELLLQAGAKTGKDYTQNLINAQAIPCCDNLQLPAVREYRKLIRTRPPKPPPGIDVQEYAPLAYSSVSFEGFLNAKALVAIIRKFGRIPTRSELPAAVESVGSLDLGLGSPVRFGPNHRQGLDKIYFTTVRDRQFAPVAEWKPQAK